MTVADSIKAQLDDAAYVIREQMERIAELEAEVERLRSAAGAHEVLRSIYADPNQPTGHRLKAAGLALGHESPPLKSVEPALDLVPEPSIPIAQLVDQQRARMNVLHREQRDIEVSPSGIVRVLPKPGNGDGSDDEPFG
jgi:hypothetical protein